MTLLSDEELAHIRADVNDYRPAIDADHAHSVLWTDVRMLLSHVESLQLALHARAQQKAQDHQ